MSMFTLYTNPMSRGLHVLWMLEECQADYDVVPVAYGEAMKSADYLAINPMGKVPALQHGEMLLTETAAIVLYLAEHFSDKGLIPAAGTAERGQLYRLMFLALHCEYAILDKYLGIENTAERRKSIGYGDFDTIVCTLRAELTGKTYLIGESFSVLDLYVSGLLGWAMNKVAVFPKDDPVFSAYLQHHGARPAFGRTMVKTQAMVEEMS